MTTALSSTTGDSWSLTLDAANRVSTLTLPERTITYAYGGHGKVATMTVADSVSGTTRMRSYDYDAQGRLVSVSGGGAGANVTYAAGLVRIDEGGEVFEYEVDERGRVAWVQQGADPEVRVERDQAGDVVEISQGHRSVRFGRDDLGRIVDAAFADGGSARLSYDGLGNRSLAEHGDRRVVEYSHDAAGNLIGVETTERDGTVNEWKGTVPTGPLERAAASGATTLYADYHATGRAVVLHSGGETVAAESIALGPSGMSADGFVADDSVGLSPWGALRAVLRQDREVGAQPDYGVVGFGDELRAVRQDTQRLGLPAYLDAGTLLHVGTKLMGAFAAEDLARPWNPAAQPLEYSALTAVATDEDSEGASDSCGCAIPTGFPQDTGARHEPRRPRFNYVWGSSTGDLADIANCKVREHVTYDAPLGKFTFPPPFDLEVDNPTTVEAEDEGMLEDTHLPPDFDGILQRVSVSAEQSYQFSCPCHENGGWVDIAGPYQIDRHVAPNSSGGWMYTITKDGATATIDPLE